MPFRTEKKPQTGNQGGSQEGGETGMGKNTERKGRRPMGPRQKSLLCSTCIQRWAVQKEKKKTCSESPENPRPNGRLGALQPQLKSCSCSCSGWAAPPVALVPVRPSTQICRSGASMCTRSPCRALVLRSVTSGRRILLPSEDFNSPDMGQV